ncbi:hypothetical protein EYZ11_004668 [Aspergillus tanneri]|uniref:Uncharacterized protein n=1 Tax=Aspergillus tanneri TaxID=1220188 RepID=A0A4S3JQR6_9EURO|nr:hypothetical protein EYZ11_004668 [Aspergillus tanneri]
MVFNLLAESGELNADKKSRPACDVPALVVDVCRREPAVWDAVNAISALFESPNPCLQPVFLSQSPDEFRTLHQNHQEALTWYSRSLSNIHMQIGRGTWT